jgi:hypothetical protein
MISDIRSREPAGGGSTNRPSYPSRGRQLQHRVGDGPGEIGGVETTQVGEDDGGYPVIEEAADKRT